MKDEAGNFEPLSRGQSAVPFVARSRHQFVTRKSSFAIPKAFSPPPIQVNPTESNQCVSRAVTKWRPIRIRPATTQPASGHTFLFRRRGATDRPRCPQRLNLTAQQF